MTDYRSDLPERPQRMLQLPLDERGFPVPWFVAFIDDKPDFRVVREGGIAMAHNRALCWLCGQRLGRYMTFVVGPMCGINRVSSEPPSHTECAEYAVRACPFLTRPMAVRNDRGLPEDAGAAGIMIERNPGVTLLWTTTSYKPFRVGGTHGNPGVLFRLGELREVKFYARGRQATRAEIEESVTSGFPKLEEMAKLDGPDGIKALGRQRREFDQIVASVVALREVA